MVASMDPVRLDLGNRLYLAGPVPIRDIVLKFKPVYDGIDTRL